MDLFKANTFISTLPENLWTLGLFQRPTESAKIRMAAVGDLSLSGRISRTGQIKGFPWLFQEIQAVFKQCDLVFANLESPFVKSFHSEKLFAAPLQAAHSLADIGFNILHLANNHIYDHGPRGLTTTLQACADNGILALGAGINLSIAQKPIIVRLNGVRIGFLGCGKTRINQSQTGPNYWEFNEKEILRAAISLRPKVDLLILSMHLGYMYINYPHPDHKKLAEQLIEYGADLILMHHAHVLQGMQLFPGGKMVFYNLGNFIMDWEEGMVHTSTAIEERRQSAIFLFDLDNKGVCFAAALPIYISDQMQVQWAIGEHGQRILENMANYSQALKGNYFPRFAQQRAERNVNLATRVVLHHLKARNWRVLKQLFIRFRPSHFFMLWKWFKIEVAKKVSGPGRPSIHATQQKNATSLTYVDKQKPPISP